MAARAPPNPALESLVRRGTPMMGGSPVTPGTAPPVQTGPQTSDVSGAATPAAPEVPASSHSPSAGSPGDASPPVTTPPSTVTDPPAVNAATTGTFTPSSRSDAAIVWRTGMARPSRDEAAYAVTRNVCRCTRVAVTTTRSPAGDTLSRMTAEAPTARAVLRRESHCATARSSAHSASDSACWSARSVRPARSSAVETKSAPAIRAESSASAMIAAASANPRRPRGRSRSPRMRAPERAVMDSAPAR
jgi:hypothetical protein